MSKGLKTNKIGWIKSNIDNIDYWCVYSYFKYHSITPELLAEVNKLDGNYMISHHENFITETVESDVDQLPTGVYKLLQTSSGQQMISFDSRHKESIVDLQVVNDITNDFNTFYNTKDTYELLGMRHRRGVLLYGPPGTGKTFTIHKIVQNFLERQLLVIITNGAIEMRYQRALSQDNRMKLIIFEEFTNTLEDNYEASADLLDFLDGETSLDNCFIVATTNYPEKLPKNIINRPGRFDKFYRADSLNVKDVRKYLEHYKVKHDANICELLVGKTVAELKEILLIHLRDRKSLIEAKKQIDEQRELAIVGFSQSLPDKDLIL